MLFTPENILLIGSILLFVSLIISKTGYRFGVPALLLFLFVGMLFGSDGIGIQFNNPYYAQFIGTVALSIILFSGGMDTKVEEIKPVIREGVILATLGVFMTAFITGLFVYLVSAYTGQHIGLTLVEALLLASVMSSTDSASVFSILRSKKLHLKYNLRPMLELESGSNDPMAYLLTILFIQMIQSATMGIGDLLLMLVVQLSVGAICGFFLGKLAVLILNKINIQYESLYPVLLLAIVFFIFSFTNLLQGNGYLAVYIGGVVVGNKRFVHKRNVTSFFDGFAWLCQIVMFLTLGLLVNPHELIGVASLGLLVGVFLILVARPLSVFLCLLPFRKLRFKAKIFVSWVGLRGAVPIIFATYPQIAGIAHADMIFNVVFFITILSLLVQGMSISGVAKWLHLALPERQSENTFGMALPDEMKSTMSEIVMTEGILSKGNMLMNLSLPDNTLVVMLKRNNQFIIPTGKTKLQPGDKLLVITDNDDELRHTYESLGLTDDDYIMQKNT
ncbi:potassium/proton antiporter [Porphyromonadaceae bacterium OttesenSCG-928-L07]|nr:potassium/proton antiporter [Porphyromonadaceae bacterium OttesenSCG-928-L07]MDL2251252.1 potassium/proton antiporter [Odoribacter sp. OttesenSCG-928-J03]